MVIFNPSRGASEESAAAGKALTEWGPWMTLMTVFKNLHQYFDTRYLTSRALLIRTNQAEQNPAAQHATHHLTRLSSPRCPLAGWVDCGEAPVKLHSCQKYTNPP